MPVLLAKASVAGPTASDINPINILIPVNAIPNVSEARNAFLSFIPTTNPNIRITSGTNTFEPKFKIY